MDAPAKERPRLDPWGAIKHEYPDESPEAREPVLPTRDPNRVTVWDAFTRFWLMIWLRPFASLMTTIGLIYGCVCIYFFARGYLLEPYGYPPDQLPGVLQIDPRTPVIAPDGVKLLIAWVVAPPLWFYLEYFVLCKTQEQRQVVREAQQLTVKLWLAMLAVMALLAKP
jgi:hypothetical protein